MIVALDQVNFLINPFEDRKENPELNFEKEFKKEMIQWTKKV